MGTDPMNPQNPPSGSTGGGGTQTFPSGTAGAAEGVAMPSSKPMGAGSTPPKPGTLPTSSTPKQG